MALPPPPDVSQPGSFCLRSVSHQNICKSMCGNWKAHVYNSWSPPQFLTDVTTLCGNNLWWRWTIEYLAWKDHSNMILKILLFSQRCHQNGHRITYCRQDESTEDHYSQGFLNSSLFDYLASDYLTIWLFGDRMEGVTELCKARRRSREGKSDYPGDWLTSSSGSGDLG